MKQHLKTPVFYYIFLKFGHENVSYKAIKRYIDGMFTILPLKLNFMPVMIFRQRMSVILLRIQAICRQNTVGTMHKTVCPTNLLWLCWQAAESRKYAVVYLNAVRQYGFSSSICSMEHREFPKISTVMVARRKSFLHTQFGGKFCCNSGTGNIGNSDSNSK